MELDEEYVKLETEICKRCVNHEFCKNYLEGDICLPLTILRFFIVEDRVTLGDLRDGIREWERLMGKTSQEF
jgi:thiaminase